MKRKIMLFIFVIFIISLGTSCAKSEFVECSSSLLDLSGNNYTIKIDDGSKYDGIYMIEGDAMKKVTKSNTYYYFAGDVNRYYRTVELSFSCTNDQSEFVTSLSVIKDFFESSRKLYTNKEKTIFKTKVGNMIYDIGTTKVYSEMDNTLYGNVKIEEIKTEDKYIFSDSTLVIKGNNKMALYINKNGIIKKFTFIDSEWQKVNSEITNYYDYRDNLYSKLSGKYICDNGVYLSSNGYSVSKFNESLYVSNPNFTDMTYTIKDYGTGYVYSVMHNYIRINNGKKFMVAYYKDGDTIYEYTSDNYDNYVSKEVCTKYEKWEDIMSELLNDFSYLYGNTLASNYVIIGDYSEYELSKYGQTNISIIQPDVERIEDIAPYLEGHNYTLKDKRQNKIYTVTDDTLQITNLSDNSDIFYNYRNSKVYCYKKVNGDWLMTETTYLTIKDVLNFDAMYQDINESKILKTTEKITTVDFVNQDYVITNYDADIEIELPL